LLEEHKAVLGKHLIDEVEGQMLDEQELQLVPMVSTLLVALSMVSVSLFSSALLFLA
jgi:hypothetical protein